MNISKLSSFFFYCVNYLVCLTKWFTKFWYKWEDRRHPDFNWYFLCFFFLNRWIWILIGEKASIFNLRNTRNTRGSQLKFWKDFLLAKHNFSVSSYNALGNSPKIKNCKHYLNQCNVWGNSNTHPAPMLYRWVDLFLNIFSGDVRGNSQNARNTLWS